MADWFCYLWDTPTEDMAFWHDEEGLHVRVQQNPDGKPTVSQAQQFVVMSLPIERATVLRDWLNREFPLGGSGDGRAE